MASITIRNLGEPLKKRLRIRAARNGHSMEEEVRVILRTALHDEASPAADLGDAIHRRFAKFGGIELALPERGPIRQPPDFSE